jgi:hypothetical protein
LDLQSTGDLLLNTQLNLKLSKQPKNAVITVKTEIPQTQSFLLGAMPLRHYFLAILAESDLLMVPLMIAEVFCSKLQGTVVERHCAVTNLIRGHRRVDPREQHNTPTRITKSPNIPSPPKSQSIGKVFESHFWRISDAHSITYIILYLAFLGDAFHQSQIAHCTG